MLVHEHIYVYMHIYVYIHANRSINKYIYIYIYLMYIHTYDIYIYIYTYIYIYGITCVYDMCKYVLVGCCGIGQKHGMLRLIITGKIIGLQLGTSSMTTNKNLEISPRLSTQKVLQKEWVLKKHDERTASPVILYRVQFAAFQDLWSPIWRESLILLVLGKEWMGMGEWNYH